MQHPPPEGDRQPDTASEPQPEASVEGGDGTPRTTPSGYEYTVVDDENERGPAPERAVKKGVPWPIALVAVIVVALLAAGGAWAAATLLGGDGDEDRVNRGVGNVLHAFSSGQTQGGTSVRYEGELPEGFPDSVPVYDGARVVASVLQVQDSNAGYLVIYDTTDARAVVADFFRARFDEDPWQIELGQDDDNSTLYQYSNVEDPDLEGIVLITSSKEGDLTSIIVSVQEVGGAADLTPQAYSPTQRSAPDGLPDEFPVYEDSTLTNSAFQQQPGTRLYALTYVTQDSSSVVLDYYRAAFDDGGYEVEELEPGAGTDGMRFTDEAAGITGELSVGELAEDDAYQQIDVQMQVTAGDGS